MTDLTPERETDIREWMDKYEAGVTATHFAFAPTMVRDLLAALDAARARNRELSEAFDRRGVELDVVLESREQIEAKAERLEAVAEAARAVFTVERYPGQGWYYRADKAHPLIAALAMLEEPQ